MKKIIVLLLIILSVQVNGQDVFYKHQFGINMGEFIPIFRTQTGNFDFNYYYHLNENIHLRSGLTYRSVLADDGTIELDSRIGFGKNIKTINKFTVYSAFDASLAYAINFIDDKHYYKPGLSALIGFRFNFSKNISVSTEPGIFWYYVDSRNPNSFGTRRTSWQEISLGNVGQLMLSFHF